jgi:hypothetical protein
VVASSNPGVVSASPDSADQQELITEKGKKFENRPLGPTILSKMSFRRSYRGSCGGATNDVASVETHRETALSIPCFATTWFPFRESEINFARDLQDRLGILALLAVSAPFRICKLQIPLAGRETDPVSGHHIFNNLQAHRATITFRNVPTARRSLSTPTPLVAKSSPLAEYLGEGKGLRLLLRTNAKARGRFQRDLYKMRERIKAVQ